MKIPTQSTVRINLICVKALELVPVPMGPINVGYFPEIITQAKKSTAKFPTEKGMRNTSLRPRVSQVESQDSKSKTLTFQMRYLKR